jgi:hypothetical protein
MKKLIAVVCVANWIGCAFGEVMPAVAVPPTLARITMPDFAAPAFPANLVPGYDALKPYMAAARGNAIELGNSGKEPFALVVNGRWITAEKDGKELGLLGIDPRSKTPLSFHKFRLRGDQLVIAVVPVKGANAFQVAQVFCCRVGDFIDGSMKLHRLLIPVSDARFKPLDAITPADVKYVKPSLGFGNEVPMGDVVGR